MKYLVLLKFLQLGRLEFAGFLFSVIVSGYLALNASTANVSDVFWLLAIAVLTNLWGFIDNDVCDVEIDRQADELSGRPLVSGDITVGSARVVTRVFIALTFAVVALKGVNSLAFSVLGASVLLAYAYNRLSKRLPGSDILFAASTALLCLLGPVSATSGSAAGTQFGGMVWTVVAVQFIDHVIFNAGASMKDVKNDRKRSAVTMATFCGVAANGDGSIHIPILFKAYIVLLKLTSLSVLLASPVWTGARLSSVHYAAICAAGLASLVLTAHAMNIKAYDRQTIGRRWVLQELAGKLPLPLMLACTAGWLWCLCLVTVPIVWFWVFNVILHRRYASLNSGF